MEKFGVQGSKDIQKDVILKEVSIRGNVCQEFAEFSIKQVYVNKGKEDIDAVYTFPIPETAVITGFEAILGGRTIKAVVEEKSEAIKIYEDAVERGINTLTLEQFKEGIFQLAIGKILSNEKVKIKISYMDQLEYEDKALKLIIPAITAPRPFRAEEEQQDEEYKLNLNLLVESVSKLQFESPIYGIHVEREDDTLAKITLKDKNVRLDEDFELFLRENDPLEASGMIYEYKEGTEEKSILYLRLIPELESEEEEGKSTNYLFLIDISESMEGEKLAEAKNALQLCLRNLNAQDSFNIVAIESDLHYFSQVRKVPFNDENLRKASEWIQNLQAAYGADIFGALKYALSDNTNGEYSTIFLFTDDLVDNENPILDYVKENIKDNRIFTFGVDSSTNCYFINKLAEIGYGKPEYIYPGERIETEVLKQFNRITNPQVDITRIDWGNLDIERTYPRTIDYLYDREPFTIFAKASGSMEGNITIYGKVGNREYKKVINLDNLDLEENANLIQKVWSRRRIESIAEKLKGERGAVAESMRNKIIEISKESGIISYETSFVLLEQIEEPILGVPLVHRIPLKISEEAMRKIAEGNFLESTTFYYKPYEKVSKTTDDREKGVESRQYDRVNLLRLLAKNQFADGHFVDCNDITSEGKLKTTLLAMIAFTLGKEEVGIYRNQINKGIEFVLQYIENRNMEFGEEIKILTIIAYKSVMDKGMIREKQKERFGNILNTFAEEQSSLYEIVKQERAALKNKLLSLLPFEKESIGKNVLEIEERDCIGELAKLAILKI